MGWRRKGDGPCWRAVRAVERSRPWLHSCLGLKRAVTRARMATKMKRANSSSSSLVQHRLSLAQPARRATSTRALAAPPPTSSSAAQPARTPSLLVVASTPASRSLALSTATTPWPSRPSSSSTSRARSSSAASSAPTSSQSFRSSSPPPLGLVATSVLALPRHSRARAITQSSARINSRTARRRSVSDIFRIHVVASSTPPTSPLITLSNTTFFHVRHGGLWLVAVCKHVSRPSSSPSGRDEMGPRAPTQSAAGRGAHRPALAAYLRQCRPNCIER